MRRSRLDCGRRVFFDGTGGKHHEIEQRGLDGGTTKAELLRAMAGHILAEARLMGTYQRAR